MPISPWPETIKFLGKTLVLGGNTKPIHTFAFYFGYIADLEVSVRVQRHFDSDEIRHYSGEIKSRATAAKVELSSGRNYGKLPDMEAFFFDNLHRLTEKVNQAMEEIT